MIIYDREKKELIVPATFAGGGDNCGPEIEIAYQEGWNEGYASGTSECSGCTLQEGGYFTPLWPETPTGIVEVFPDEGYDGFSKFSVNDGAALWSFHAAGLESGRAEGYAEGWQSGWTSGYTKGYEDGSGTPPHVSFDIAISGTIVMEADEVITRQHGIIVFVGNAGALDDGYIEVDGDTWGSWKSEGRTLSAGTHTFLAYVSEFQYYDQIHGVFEVEGPLFTIDWTNSPVANTHFVFHKYKD